MAGKQLAKYEDFQVELNNRANDLVTMLPAGANRQRFINSTLAAVRQTPDLLTATPRSLFSAITKSAQDGLLPDGKEGVITIFKTKNRETQAWEASASWNPMVWGLRKRAKELDNIIISANVVYDGDEFEQVEGDEPKIVHVPAKLGQPRGDMIGAYAIFKRIAPGGEEEILHREVMDKAEIEAVRSQSKQPDGLMWTKFTTEAWKKTVVRRGIKSVPCSEKLEAIAHRDDEQYDFSEPKAPKHIEIIKPTPEGETRALPPAVEHQQAVADTVGDIIDGGAETVEAPVTAKPLPPAAKKNGNGKKPPAPKAAAPAEPKLEAAITGDGAPDYLDSPENFRKWVKGKLKELNGEIEIRKFWQASIETKKGIIFPPDMDELMALVSDRVSELSKEKVA